VAAGERFAEELATAAYFRADLTDDAAVEGLVPSVIARFGRLDVLVNNAGISRVIPHGDLARAAPPVWRELFEINVIAPWRLISAAVPHLRKSGGSIVNITSHAGVRPKGASIPYAVSKAGLNHMTKLLAAALGPEVRVNAVAPGLVDTPLTADWLEARRLWRESSPMQRAATPADISAAVLWLVKSDYVTGEIVVLDGGLNLR
jgi:NAD(P)-dependent dehydrogenase (short-subunit alcohol dehydrogenase family)